MVHVVSVSGGRTSALMVHELERLKKEKGWHVEYVFFDTSAEHPKTYEFLRSVAAHYGIKIHCLKGRFNQPIKTGHTVDVLGVNEIGTDMKAGAYNELVQKYGIPHVAGAFCTTRMKEETCNKFCESMGWRERTNWVGYRADEPARYFGKTCWQELKAYGMPFGELANIFRAAVRGESLSDFYLAGSTRELITLRAETLKQKKLRYLVELSDMNKADVNAFWSKMPFDLEIPDHLGNCVFCFKKSLNKVALAMRDEPELFAQWRKMIMGGNERLSKLDKYTKDTIYREKNNFASLEAKFAHLTRDELAATLKGVKEVSCGGTSCEPFSQIDLLGAA